MIIERELYFKIKPFFASPEAIIITGMRRVGKTTLLRYIMERINSENKIFLDLENPANRKYFEEDDYDKIKDNLTFLGLDPGKRGYVFLDEIQFVKNIPSVVKYLLDHYRIKFFMSGSASFYLKNLFSESLAGRKFIFELYPFSFWEFIRVKNFNFDSKMILKKKLTQAMFSQIEKYYNEYVLYGGFPGVINKESVQEKKAALDDIFTSYFQLEVVQLGDFKKINIFRDLTLLLMERTGSKLDVQKLSKELGISRETVNNYIAFLENTYFIKLIKPFSRNKDTEIRSTPKFYACDSGLANHLARVNEGSLFENSVFLSLQKRGGVNYYQKKSGVEIDFILNKKHAYEVKLSANRHDLEKLKKLSDEVKMKSYKLVSKKYSELNNNVIYGFLI